MRIALTINYTGEEDELYDHPVTAELGEWLPLDLVFNDFNGGEKVAVLNRPLTLRGIPAADAPFAAISDITLPAGVWCCTTAAREGGRA